MQIKNVYDAKSIANKMVYECKDYRATASYDKLIALLDIMWSEFTNDERCEICETVSRIIQDIYNDK